MTDEEVAAAKKNMLADVYTMLEAPLNQIENMGSQVPLLFDVFEEELFAIRSLKLQQIDKSDMLK